MWTVHKLLHLGRYVVVGPNYETMPILFTDRRAADGLAAALNERRGPN